MADPGDFWRQENPLPKTKRFLKNHLSDWLFLFLGFSLILLGLGQRFGWWQEEAVTVALSQEEDFSARPVWVDIQGAVVKPGLYRLPPDSRVEDLLQACDGPTRFASREFIAKELNRARRLSDEEKVYIPYFEPETEVEPTAAVGDSRVNINRADAAALEALPGIGPVYARRITDWRRQNGSFSQLEELKQISGIGDKVLEKISDQTYCR